MRDAFRPTLSNTVAGDLASFYGTMSRCTGLDLRAGRDPLLLYRPAAQDTRNAREYMVMCEVAGQLVVIKRCADRPDFVRRELVVSQVRSAIGWVPDYPVIPLDGISLREPPGRRNCAPFRGWGDKKAVAIGAGAAGASMNMLELGARDISSPELFFYDLGRWSAFNYLLVVHDRNFGNFAYFPKTRELRSIDNEEGPFSPSGAFVGPFEVVSSTRHVVRRFLGPDSGMARARSFRHGFSYGWRALESNRRAVLGILDAREGRCMERLLEGDPKDVSESFLRRGP